MKNLFFLFSILYGSFKVVAQDDFRGLYQPKINIGYSLNKSYAHEFSFENRNFVYKDSEFDYLVKHLEIAHTSKIRLNEKQSFGLGIQYRFQDNFEGLNENEFRVVQRFSFINKKSRFQISQSVRTEQRIYASTTKFRNRYEIGLTFPLSKKSNYFLAETETLLELATTQKPEFEHRLSTIFGWELTEKIAFETGVEYRVSDYTQDLKHELFFIANWEIKF